MSSDPTLHANLPEDLAAGYREFRDGRFKEEKQRFRDLADHGQRPPVLLIGCSDSRVAPEVIFDAGPGEIFVVRNIANLVPPFGSTMAAGTATAIEYAVIALAVAHIVILGHAQCGGIRAFAKQRASDFEPLTEDDYVAQWTAFIAPAADKLGPQDGDFNDYCESLCRASIIQGIANLRTYSWIKAREAAGKLSLHGVCFGVADGSMTALDQTRGVFVPVLPK